MRFRSSMLLGAFSLMAATASSAQSAVSTKSTVLSMQPVTAMFTIYSVEVEQRLGSKLTLGAGGSSWSFGDATELAYRSGDVKLRYYPEGHALTGFAFGVQGGYTKIRESSTNSTTGATSTHEGGAPTAGISLDYNLLLGDNRSFFIGLGTGVKKVFIRSETFNNPVLTYPTGRFSIGYAF